MDKDEIRAAAIVRQLATDDYTTSQLKHDIEAALTAAHTAGGKDEYDKGWNEGVKEAAGTAREILSLSRNLTASELEAEVIRRLKNGQGE